MPHLPVSDAQEPHKDSMFVLSYPPSPDAPLPEFQPCIPVKASTSSIRLLSLSLEESSWALSQLLVARYIAAALLQRLSCGVGDRRYRLLDLQHCHSVRTQVSMKSIRTISRKTSGL